MSKEVVRKQEYTSAKKHKQRVTQLRYLRMPKKPEAYQGLSVLTSHHIHTWSALWVAAKAGEFHLQLQQRNTSENNSEPELLNIGLTHTPVKVPGQPLAGRTCESGGRAVNHGAGLTSLSLSASAVAELGTQDREATWWGGIHCLNPRRQIYFKNQQ